MSARSRKTSPRVSRKPVSKKLHVEGLTNCDWVLIDTGEVILHVFRPEVREFYNLERLWTQSPSDEPRIDLKAV